MKENLKSGLGESAYDVVGTAAYDISGSLAIDFKHVVNSWIRNVKTYRPTSYTNPWHIHSRGIRLRHTRQVTIQNVDIRNSEYTGGNGNGYLIALAGNDNLVTSSHVENGRHNLSLAQMSSNGNVIHRVTSGYGWHLSDFHQHLAMSNLIDNYSATKNAFESRNRSAIGDGHHGITSSQTVFWNAKGNEPYPRRNLDGDVVDYIIHSDQHGWGYVIGTSGTTYKVKTTQYSTTTNPIDFVEGVGQGNNLVPQSLYEDQLARRLGNKTSTPLPTSTSIPLPTSTPSPTPTRTPSPSPIRTPSPTPSPSKSPTPLPTRTPTPLPTNTPLLLSTPTPTPYPTQPPVACVITNTYWKSPANPIPQDTPVSLAVVTSGDCQGKQVAFKVWEDDGPLDSRDPVQLNPHTVTLSTNTALSTWTTEWQKDGPFGLYGNPEYYFVATLTDGTSSMRSASPLLEVSKR